MKSPESSPTPNSKRSEKGKGDKPWSPIDPTTFATYHEQPNGTVKREKNANVAEASNRLFYERQRKDREAAAAARAPIAPIEAPLIDESPVELGTEPIVDTRDYNPIANNLYRINKAGLNMRPVKSSDEFFAQAGVARSSEGNQGSYISTGKNEKSPSDETRDINQYSEAIIKSYEARDAALSEGTGIEQAQEIGAAAYRAALYDSGETPTDSEEILDAEIIDDDPDNNSPETPEDEDIVDAEIVDDKPETSDGKAERKEHLSTEKVATFLRTTGRHAIVAFKTAQAAGISTIASGAYYKLADVVLPKKDEILDDIDTVLLDLKVDARRISQNTIEKYKSLSTTLGERRGELAALWDARKEQAKKNKAQRAETKSNARDEDNERAARIANDIRAYLESKRKLFT